MGKQKQKRLHESRPGPITAELCNAYALDLVRRGLCTIHILDYGMKPGEKKLLNLGKRPGL